MTTPTLALSAVSHLTLAIADLDVAARFYVGLLGLPLIRRVDRDNFADLVPERSVELDADNSPFHLSLGCGEIEIDLFLQPDHARRALRPHPHLAFAVAADTLDASTARLRDAGVAVDGPRRLGPPGQASVYFTDPFGNLLELTTMNYAGDVEIGPPDLGRLGRPTGNDLSQATS